jgi:hypothetical protein
VAKKKLQFLFSEATGFNACYDRRYYPVTFEGFSDIRKTAHIPDVTKLLLQK